MVDSATDVVTEGATATSGTDLIQTTLTTYTLGANLENLTFTGTGSFTGTGNAVGNVLTGGIGNDVLDGGLGNDTLNGGAGVDTASYASATAGVTVNLGLLTAQNTVGSGTDTLSLIENLRGSGFNDTLTGDGQVNTIIGGVGADSLTGGLGSDIFQFAAGDSGQAATTIDNLVDLVKGALGTGDLIDYATNLTIGGSNAVATGTEASINATTGVATFAAGSGTTLAMHWRILRQDSRQRPIQRVNLRSSTSTTRAIITCSSRMALPVSGPMMSLHSLPASHLFLALILPAAT